jgi:uncharacterized protein YraI
VLQSIITGLRNRGYGFATAADLLAGTAEPPAPIFDIGDTVRVTSGLYLRTEPNFSGRVIVTMPTGTIGTVVGGPSPANGHTWFQLQTTYGTGWASTVGLVETTAPAPTPPPTVPKFVVGDNVRVTAGLYLRTGPGTGTSVIVTMPTGTVGTVQAGPSPLNGYTWYQIQTSYGTGWAAAEYLVKTTATPPPPPSGAWPAGTRVRATANLRLRASPSTGATIRATMPTGTVCTVVAGPQAANGYTWYQVESAYGTGWAASQYLVRI